MHEIRQELEIATHAAATFLSGAGHRKRMSGLQWSMSFDVVPRLELAVAVDELAENYASDRGACGGYIDDAGLPSAESGPGLNVEHQISMTTEYDYKTYHPQPPTHARQITTPPPFSLLLMADITKSTSEL